MRIAYLIIAHDLPEQVVRLAAILTEGSPSSRVFVHYDAKAAPSEPDRLRALERVALVPDPVAVEWGDFSQVEATLRSLAFIRRTMDFDWFILISGRDFPIKPIAELERFLEATEYEGFVEGAIMEECQRPSHVYARYYYRYWTLPRFPYAYRLPAWLLRGWRQRLAGLSEKKLWINYMWMPRGLPGRIGIHTYRHPYRKKLRCYMGSQWLNLSRRAVDYLLTFLERNPDVLEHYRHSIIPDEGLVQSILCSAENLRISPRNLRFILFEDDDAPHPVTLTCEHWEQIIASDGYFARKFDGRVDGAILDRLERHITSGRQAGSSEPAIHTARVQKLPD
jgi:hypothetical protein